MRIMRNRFLSLFSAAALAALLSFAPTAAQAVPVLQLDILGGTYDTVTDTIVTDADTFTLYAYLNGGSLDDTYYLSVALAPQVSSPANLGSFVVNGTTYAATGDMTYGVPPIEADGTAAHDGGDFPPHGIFETYFIEIPFQFDPANLSGLYNTQDDPGLGPIPGSDMYFAAFQVDRSGLASGTELHFDLYTKAAGQCPGPPTKPCADLDFGIFAPPSHDAGTVPGTPPVPEPSAALVFAAGAVLAGCARRTRG